jgi:hypothetical protein
MMFADELWVRDLVFYCRHKKHKEARKNPLQSVTIRPIRVIRVLCRVLCNGGFVVQNTDRTDRADRHGYSRTATRTKESDDSMAKAMKTRDSIPEGFRSFEEAGNRGKREI